jgi:hypothetical protein
MGLDQYAYKVKCSELNTDFSFPKDNRIKIAYWRKHPYLQGWMENLFNRKADAQNFDNGIEFNVEPITNIVGTIDKDKVTPEIEALAVSSDEMQERIKEQQMIATVSQYVKNRVFNCQPIRLTLTDIDQLEAHIMLGTLPETRGFFFGDDSSNEYREEDLAFIEEAKKAIAEGYDVYYDSWW